MAQQENNEREVVPKTIRKFHASGYKSIEERFVESESDTMVTIGYDRLLRRVIRYKKSAKEESWFDTWEEAHAFLQRKVAREVAEAEVRLRVWKATQQELLAIVPPEPKGKPC